MDNTDSAVPRTKTPIEILAVYVTEISTVMKKYDISGLY